MRSSKKYEREAEILKTIGHPVRLKIIEGLLQAECNVKKIWTELKLPQATVSQHLALLKNRNIVSSYRKGVTMCYLVSDPVVKKIMDILRSN